MRGELLRFSNGAALINDSYNSSPAALQAMTELLAATPGFRRRILAAGEMRELGSSSRRNFTARREFAAAKTGKSTGLSGWKATRRKLSKARWARDSRRHKRKFFASSEDAAKFLRQIL